MKVYNYSDQPIYVHGVAHEGHLPYLYNSIERWNVVHDGRYFIQPTGTERNAVYTIANTNSGYKYKIDYITPPDIFPWIFLFITFFGFWFSIKLIQKIKTR